MKWTNKHNTMKFGQNIVLLKSTKKEHKQPKQSKIKQNKNRTK